MSPMLTSLYHYAIQNCSISLNFDFSEVSGWVTGGWGKLYATQDVRASIYTTCRTRGHTPEIGLIVMKLLQLAVTGIDPTMK